MPQTRLVTRLKDIDDVTALVGSGDDARIYPAVVTQGESLPYITHQLISCVPVNVAGGATSTQSTRIQVDCWAASYDGARTLAAAVQGDQAELAPSGVSGWVDRQQSVWHMENKRDGASEVPAGRGKPQAYHVIMDFLVWHE